MRANGIGLSSPPNTEGRVGGPENMPNFGSANNREGFDLQSLSIQESSTASSCPQVPRDRRVLTEICLPCPCSSWTLSSKDYTAVFESIHRPAKLSDYSSLTNLSTRKYISSHGISVLCCLFCSVRSACCPGVQWPKGCHQLRQGPEHGECMDSFVLHSVCL